MCTISSSSSLSSVLRKKQHRGGVRKPGRIGHVIRHKPLDMETYCSPWASHDLSLPHPSSQCGGFPQGAQGTQTSVHGMPRVPWTCRHELIMQTVHIRNSSVFPKPTMHALLPESTRKAPGTRRQAARVHAPALS